MKHTVLTHLSAIAGSYDGFILDLWGVIHDGVQPYPGARECLKALRGEGKKIVLLSNAPRRAGAAQETLRRMGIEDSCYDALITSGETAYQCLAGKHPDYFEPEGERYIYIGLEKDRMLLEGLRYREAQDPMAADFLLLSHAFYDNQPKPELAPLMGQCLQAGLIALCVNPDREVVRQSGEHVYCAGELAQAYAAQGGRVLYFGKPHSLVYDVSLRLLKAKGAERILAVGDNLATDILGAQRAGLKSMLVTGGILKRSLGEPGSETYERGLAAVLAEAKVSPNYVIPAFQWQQG